MPTNTNSLDADIDTILLGVKKDDTPINWRTDEMRAIQRLTLSEAKAAIQEYTNKRVIEELTMVVNDPRKPYPKLRLEQLKRSN